MIKLKKDSYYQDLEQRGYYDTLDKRTRDYKEYKQWKTANLEVKFDEIKSSKVEDGSVGLGDVVEKVAKVTGVKSLIDNVFGEDCGCDERKEKFNKIRLWKRRKVKCIKKDDYVWFKDFTSTNPKRFNFEQRKRLTKIYNHIFNESKSVTSCGSCITRLIRNINDYLKVWEG